jgi:hypothetical protein
LTKSVSKEEGTKLGTHLIPLLAQEARVVSTLFVTLKRLEVVYVAHNQVASAAYKAQSSCAEFYGHWEIEGRPSGGMVQLLVPQRPNHSHAHCSGGGQLSFS